MNMNGYSLLEVIVAVFILASVMLASFSVLENGSRVSLKEQNKMIAVRLAEQIVEQLRARRSSDIAATLQDIAFPAPFADYLYSVTFGDFPGALQLTNPKPQAVTVNVTGPASASLSVVLARQPYQKP